MSSYYAQGDKVKYHVCYVTESDVMSLIFEKCQKSSFSFFIVNFLDKSILAGQIIRQHLKHYFKVIRSKYTAILSPSMTS